jgi:hypothetical protein
MMELWETGYITVPAKLVECFWPGDYRISANPSHGLANIPTDTDEIRSEIWISFVPQKLTPVKWWYDCSPRLSWRKLTQDHQPPCRTIINQDAETCIVAPLAYLNRQQVRPATCGQVRKRVLVSVHILIGKVVWCGFFFDALPSTCSTAPQDSSNRAS